MKIHPMIIKARARLSYEKGYFGTALWALRFVEKKDLLQKHGVPAACDKYWRVYYDPDLFDKLTLPQVRFLIEHELYHLIRGHAERGEAKGISPINHEAWNAAGDCEINDDLVKDLSVDFVGCEAALTQILKRPCAFCLPNRLNPPQANGLTAEVYYQSFPELHGQPNCGSGASGVHQGWEDGRPQDGEEVPKIGRAEAHILRKYTADRIREHIRNRGTVPAGLARWADEFGKPTIDWHQELAALVRNNLARAYGQHDYTYQRYNRRQPFYGQIIMPAMLKPLPRFALVADTSGSMGDTDLKAVLAETEGLLRGFGIDAPFYSCDADVYGGKRIRSAKSAQLRGGGGTDMRVGIRKAEEDNRKLDCVIILTDGMTPWPDEPTQYPLVIVLTQDAETPAWAKTVRIHDRSGRKD